MDDSIKYVSVKYFVEPQDLTVLSVKDLKKIADHMSLPITYFSFPEMQDQIDILDPYFNTKKIYDTCAFFIKNRPDLIDLVSKFSYKLISAIQNSEGYRSFQEANLDEMFPVGSSGSSAKTPDQNIYCEMFKDKTLVSLDLTQANFQVMNLVAPQIFQGHSFNDYAAMFSEDYYAMAYFNMSKKLRQVVFGNLNPSRQMNIMKRLIRRYADFVLAKYPELVIVSGTHDELILSGYKPEMDLSYDKLNIKKSVFTVKEGGEPNKYKYYYKLSSDGKISIKGVPSYLLGEVCCHLSNIPVPDSARMFMHEGRKAMFLDPLY